MSDAEPHTSRHWEHGYLHPLVAEAVALARELGLEPDAQFLATERDLLKGVVSPHKVVEDLRLRAADAETIAGLNFAEEFRREGRGWAEADADGNLICYGPDGEQLVESTLADDRPVGQSGDEES